MAENRNKSYGSVSVADRPSLQLLTTQESSLNWVTADGAPLFENNSGYVHGESAPQPDNLYQRITEAQLDEVLRQLPHVDFEQSEKSIFRYYLLEHEVAFLKGCEGLSHQEKFFYIQENILRFLGEFVNKSPYTKIKYLHDGKNLLYGSQKIMSSYQKAADITGQYSREKDELAGCQAIEAGLATNNVAIWLSPPKIADYGFNMVWKKERDEKLGKDVITEYLLRYDEKMSATDRSQQIMDGVDPSRKYSTAREFLRNPVIFHSTSPQEEVSVAMALTGISDRDIQRSDAFERAAQEQLGPDMALYYATINRLLFLNQRDPQYAVCENALKVILATIYRKAESIRDQLDNPKPKIPTTPHSQSGPSLSDFYHFMALGAPQVQQASDCMGIMPSMGYVSSYDIFTSMQWGGYGPDMWAQPRVEKKSTLKCTCPFCEKKVTAQIDSVKQKISCPKCKKSAPYRC